MGQNDKIFVEVIVVYHLFQYFFSYFVTTRLIGGRKESLDIYNKLTGEIFG